MSFHDGAKQFGFQFLSILIVCLFLGVLDIVLGKYSSFVTHWFGGSFEGGIFLGLIITVLYWIIMSGISRTRYPKDKDYSLPGFGENVGFTYIRRFNYRKHTIALVIMLFFTGILILFR